MYFKCKLKVWNKIKSHINAWKVHSYVSKFRQNVLTIDIASHSSGCRANTTLRHWGSGTTDHRLIGLSMVLTRLKETQRQSCRPQLRYTLWLKSDSVCCRWKSHINSCMADFKWVRCGLVWNNKQRSCNWTNRYSYDDTLVSDLHVCFTITSSAMQKQKLKPVCRESA